jgi:hypothetical protein
MQLGSVRRTGTNITKLRIGDLRDRDEMTHRAVKQVSAYRRLSHKWNHAITASRLPVTSAINHTLSTHTQMDCLVKNILHNKHGCYRNTSQEFYRQELYSFMDKFS